MHDNNHENGVYTYVIMVKEYLYISSEGDGSPLFMSHPNLVMSKTEEDLADRLLSTISPACELASCEAAD